MATSSSTAKSKQELGQQRRKEKEDLLKMRDIQRGSTLLEQKKSPGTAGERMPSKLISNVHILKLIKTQQIYHYTVEILAANRRTNRVWNVTDDSGQRRRDDFLTIHRRDTCREVFAAFEQHIIDELRASNNMLYYDLSKTLFSLTKLKLNEGEQGRYEFIIPNIPNDMTHQNFEFIVTPTYGFELSNNLSFVSNNTANVLRALEQFLDIATSRSISMDRDNFITFSSSRTYMLSPVDHGFEDADCPFFPENRSFLGIGSHKASRVIEGKEGFNHMSAATVIQVKKSAFHDHLQTASVLVKARGFVTRGNVENGEVDNGEHETLRKRLIGIYVEPHYGPGIGSRSIRIDDITPPNGNGPQNAETTIIPDINISVQQYFLVKYGIKLQYPKAPLIVNYIRRDNTIQTNYYPMELCKIWDCQRVKGAQQSPRQIGEMITRTAIPPVTLRQHNAQVKQALGLVNNDYLRRASVQFENNPLEVDARIIDPPSIEYRNRVTVRPPKDTSAWKQPSHAHYSRNAQIVKWVAYGFGSQQLAADLHFTEELWKKFVQMYTDEMRTKGIGGENGSPLPAPYEVTIRWIDTTQMTALDDITITLHKEAINGAEFALVAHAPGAGEGDKVHDALKFAERHTEIVTQAVTYKTVNEVVNRHKPLTLANCIHKTNMKMGGLNYSLMVDNIGVAPLFDGHTLFIGFSMNHPGFGQTLETPAVPPNNNNNKKEGGGGNGNNAGNGNSQHTPPDRNNNNNGEKLPAPSCIGWAANLGTSTSVGAQYKDEYVGDFVYQVPRFDEKFELIARVVKQCIQRFRAKNGEPRRIVILRNACPEGQFANIMEFEIPLVKHEMADLKCAAKMTVIVPNKKQDVRFIRQQIEAIQSSAEQNIRPGTVVDTGVVHPKRTEFFLNSHVALQGTARTPRYTLLCDENNLSMDALQAMVHFLCFGHQIVTSPTSLPSPVFIAEEYAKRGRNIFNYYDKHGLNLAPHQHIGFQWPPRTYDDLTMGLSMVETEYLKHLRINA